MSQEPDEERSQYVTVYHQLKDRETRERGDRFVVHGEYHGDRYIFGDNGDFVPSARPIAIIDVGAKISDDQVTEWCNSHAGQAALSRFFEGIEPDDPTLPDCEEYVEVSADG